MREVFSCVLFMLAQVAFACPSKGDDAGGILDPFGPTSHSEGCYCVATSSQDESGPHLTFQWVNWEADQTCVLECDGHFAPQKIKLNDSIFWIDRGTLQRHRGAFCYGEKGAVALPLYDSSPTDEFRSPANPSMRDDPSLPVHLILKTETNLISHNRSRPYTSQIRNSNGAIMIWYRAPIEREILGHRLRAISVSSSSGAEQLFFNLQGNSLPTASRTIREGRFRPWLSKRLPTTLAEKSGLEIQKNQYSKLILSDFAQSTKWSTGSVTSASKIRSMLEEQPIRADHVPDLEHLVLLLAMNLSHQVDELCCHEEALILDPFYRGMVLQQSFPDPGSLDDLINDIAWISGHLSKRGGKLAFSVMGRLADAGLSPTSTTFTMLTNAFDGKHSTAVSATLLARWGWPLSEKHVHALLKKLQSAGPNGISLDATEALLAAGYFEKIPRHKTERWFSKRVLGQDRTVYRRSLNLLIQTQDGRDFLRNKMESQLIVGQEREMAFGLLQKLVTSTRKFKQFDYATASECDSIEIMLQHRSETED